MRLLAREGESVTLLNTQEITNVIIHYGNFFMGEVPSE